MTDHVQHAFMRALLDTPGVTRQAIARRVGVDASQVSRWISGDRNLRLGDALYLVERWGGRPLVEAGRVVGLEVEVSDTEIDETVVDTGEIRVELLAALAGEAAQLAGELMRPATGSQGREALIQRVRAIEELCRRVQVRLLHST